MTVAIIFHNHFLYPYFITFFAFYRKIIFFLWIHVPDITSTKQNVLQLFLMLLIVITMIGFELSHAANFLSVSFEILISTLNDRFYVHFFWCSEQILYLSNVFKPESSFTFVAFRLCLTLQNKT